MREFLHFSVIHHWGKWSEIKKIGSRGPSFFLRPVGSEWHVPAERTDVYGQDRHCLICNKEDTREINTR